MEHGSFALDHYTWSFYGSSYGPDDRNWELRWRFNHEYAKIHKYLDDERKEFKSRLESVKLSDINWEKCSIPQYRHESTFSGTGEPSEKVEILRMNLEFNDGTKFFLYKDLEYIDTKLELAFKTLIATWDAMQSQTRLEDSMDYAAKLVQKYV